MIQRREFIVGLGSAAAWPVVARAQQRALPVVGLLPPPSATASDKLWNALIGKFREGLKEQGYIEGQNVTIAYEWADGHYDRLPALAADLVRRRVAVMATVSHEPTFAAKGATSSIPIVFTAALDPVKLGFVASLAHPGGNMTGVNLYNAELTAKRLELLRELVPTATRIAILVDPLSPANTESTLREAQAVARSKGLRNQSYRGQQRSGNRGCLRDHCQRTTQCPIIDFATLFSTQYLQLIDLTARHNVPAIYTTRQFAEAGGLISYGSNIADAWRQAGVYAGRI